MVSTGAARRGGPWVREAFFCDAAIEGKDGVFTYVRAVDRVDHHVLRPDAPAVLEPFDHDFVFVVGMVAGDARGRSTLHLALQQPGGGLQELGQYEVRWEKPHGGQRIVLGARIRIESEGLHWLVVEIDDFNDGHRRVLTQSPIEIAYVRNPP